MDPAALFCSFYKSECASRMTPGFRMTGKPPRARTRGALPQLGSTIPDNPGRLALSRALPAQFRPDRPESLRKAYHRNRPDGFRSPRALPRIISIRPSGARGDLQRRRVALEFPTHPRSKNRTRPTAALDSQPLLSYPGRGALTAPRRRRRAAPGSQTNTPPPASCADTGNTPAIVLSAARCSTTAV